MIRVQSKTLSSSAARPRNYHFRFRSPFPQINPFIFLVGSGDDRFYTVDFASGRNFDRMDRNAKWAFVIHGFLGTCRKDWPLEMLRVLSASEPMNVCCVDWSRWASCNYVPDATRYVYAVGDYVAYIIRSMSNFWNIDLQRFIIIGHSFGGIITGIIGKQFTNPKLPIGIGEYLYT